MNVTQASRLFLRLGHCVRCVRLRKMSNFAALTVRCVPGEERMKICFDYSQDGKNTRTFNMDRSQSEEVGKALARLKASIVSKMLNKKKKKKSAADSSPEETIPVEFTGKAASVAETTANKDAWVQGAELKIGETVYVVDVNPPAVIDIGIPDNIMSGFPIFPSVQLDFADEKECEFIWRRARPIQRAENATEKNRESVQFEEFVEVSRDLIYTPTNEDIGYHLQVVCKPKQGEREGKEFVLVSKVEVSAGPGLCPFEHRHLYTPVIADPARFRVVTYNILADLYADSDFSRDHLYPYCPPYALSLSYRAQLLLKELRGYNADVICLQEVDKKLFEHELLTALTLLGLEGQFRCKGGQVMEGCATFYRKSKFSLVDQQDILLSGALQNDGANADLRQMLSSNEAMAEKVQSRTTILQVTVLAPVAQPERRLVVANTHLYFHPRADSVRLLQGVVALRHLRRVCDNLRQQGKVPSLIFCGDFNCVPIKGIAHFMMNRFIGADDGIWTSAEEECSLPGMELRHDFELTSGCGILPYTNYVGGFHAMLDYIFLDERALAVDAIIPSPEHEEVTQCVALPSMVFPSDHIAQICDLSWKP